MIQATLVDKATGTPFGRVSVGREEQLDVYRTNETDVVLGWDLEQKPLHEAEMKINDIRNERNQLLENTAWTIRQDSPLTPQSQARWLVYRKQLHRLLLDNPDPTGVEWPPEPELEYEVANVAGH